MTNSQQVVHSVLDAIIDFFLIKVLFLDLILVMFSIF